MRTSIASEKSLAMDTQIQTHRHRHTDTHTHKHTHDDARTHVRTHARTHAPCTHAHALLWITITIVITILK